MSMRQQVMMGLLAITLVAMLGMNAARNVTLHGLQGGILADPDAPGELLAARLNVTNIVRTPRAP